VEGALEVKNLLTDFAMGIIIGFMAAGIIFGCIAGVVYQKHKNKELLEYVERQQAIEELREDVINRDFVEFLETMPDVRSAADGAIADFERKRDEILERFRSRIID
jgi:hypothetical protein